MPLKQTKVLGKFKNENLVDKDHGYWGQWLSVSEVAPGKKSLMLAFLIEKNSTFKPKLAKYIDFIKDYKSTWQQSGFSVREVEKFYIGNHNIDGYGLLFPPTGIKKLADIVDFQATNDEYHIKKNLSDKDLQLLFESLEKELKILHQNKVCHTFIDPNLIILTDNKYHLVLPNFHLLLSDIGNNIRTILYEQPDLQVFPLAPELIKDPSLREFKDIQKCDVWSLGILLYLLIEKKLPFHFKSESQYLSAIKADQINLDFGAQGGTPVAELVRDSLKISPDQRISLEQFFERVKSVLSVAEAPKQIAVLKDSTPLTVNILNFDEQQITLRRDDKKRFGFDIAPATLNLQPEISYRFEVVVKSPDIQNQEGSLKYPIECLPTPKITIVESQISLTRVAKIKDEGNYKLLIPFRLLRSKIKIVDIKVKIIDKNGADIKSNPKSKIKFPADLLSANAVGDEYFVELLFTASEGLSLDEVYTIELIFKLHAREKPEEFKFNTVLRSPANLLVNESEKIELRIVGMTKDDLTITISNKGESEATLTGVEVSQELHFIRVKHHQELDIQQNQSVPLKLTIDGTHFTPGSFKTGNLTLIYKEKFQGKVKEGKKQFPVQMIFSDRYPNAIETIAIDFGTSNSCIAIRESDGNIDLYEWGGILSENNNVPTFINYSKLDGSVTVGKDAKTAFEAGEINCFNSVKRYFPNEILNSILKADGQLGFKSFTEIVTDYLEELTKHIANNPRTNLKTIIFTHPINWGSNKIGKFRHVISTLRVCGKDVAIKFVDEATAGALHILNGMNEDSNLMIFDIGGGTTDIVYGKLIKEVDDGIWGENEHKKFIPIFTSGFSFGGDIINEIIGMELVRLLERRGILLPFFKFEDSFDIPKPIWHLVMPTYSRIWKFAEDFKLSLGKGDHSDMNKIEGVIPLQNGCNISRINNWQIGSNTPTNIELTEEELGGIAKESMKKVGDNLLDIISKVWKYKEANDPGGDCRVVLLGQSSKFEFLQNIFFYYFNDNQCSEEKLLGYEMPEYINQMPMASNANYSVEIPLDGKSLVAKGALRITLRDGEYPVLDDSRLLSRIESSKNPKMFFKVGAKKVDPSYIINNGKWIEPGQDSAVIQKDFDNVSLLNNQKLQFIEKTPHGPPADFGEPITFDLGPNVSGRAKLILFVDLVGKIKWVLSDKDNSVIQKSW